MDNKKFLTIIIVATIIITIMGGTLAYWNWQSSTAQKTNVTFTIGANFSCGADGGGNIINTNYFVPTDCTNTTYAIQRTITTSITNNSSDEVYMDLWLNINSIDSGLTGSNNFKYALTTNSTSCTSDVVASGTFKNKNTGDTIKLLNRVTLANIYYLFVWLDSAETSSSTMNQSVDLSLGGECTNQHPDYKYTVNFADSSKPNNNYVLKNNPIPDDITQYNTSIDAMNAYNNKPFFLRHSLNSSMNVTASYVGFVISSTQAQANSGTTAGLYYIQGGVYEGSSVNKPVYASNKTILLKAFGSNHCNEAATGITCQITGLHAYANMDGRVRAYDDGNGSCIIYRTAGALCGPV